jgi:hypothetical protein
MAPTTRCACGAQTRRWAEHKRASQRRRIAATVRTPISYRISDASRCSPLRGASRQRHRFVCALDNSVACVVLLSRRTRRGHSSRLPGWFLSTVSTLRQGPSQPTLRLQSPSRRSTGRTQSTPTRAAAVRRARFASRLQLLLCTRQRLEYRTATFQTSRDAASPRDLVATSTPTAARLAISVRAASRTQHQIGIQKRARTRACHE